jgi:RHS repeat-associated protein
MKYFVPSLLLLLSLFSVPAAQAATTWSTQDYDLFPGDFTNAGQQGFLFIAKNPSADSGIALSDGSGPNVLWQTWPSNYLGLNWSSSAYKVIVADFNGDHRADILLQSTLPGGTSYLLLTDLQGHVSTITQAIAANALGPAFTADQHILIAGDFNGDGKADLFMQATSGAGQSAVILADSTGQFTSGPANSWSDGYLGLNWSTPRALVYAGDFDGDGYIDLLVQARPKMVMIDYDVPFPVPTYPPNLNGVVFSLGTSSPFPSSDTRVVSWSRNAFGVDWSPLTTNLVIGHFAGTLRSDVLLQAKNSSGTSYLLAANGTSTVFPSSATAINSSPPLSGNQYKLIAVNFTPGPHVRGTSPITALYYQSTTSSGTNYIARVVSASTTTVAASPYSPGNPTTQASTLPTAPGRTPTSFDVSPSGAATYSIPLTMPPGVGPLQLKLSLTYNSQQQDGLLGVGWKLGGLSAITRCNRTVAQDGIAQGVTLVNDRFCLDGKQLKLTGGTYGLPGSSYATELESFALIAASSSPMVGQGPASFTVTTKSGLIYQYGTTSDSQIYAGTSGTIRTWALSQISDRIGNAIKLTYNNDTANGTYRIQQIQYPFTATGSGPYYTVGFVYSPRPSADIPSGYIAGYAVREPNQLSTITSSTVSGNLIKQYNLAYTPGAQSGRQTLTAVQECTASTCLQPTSIAYQAALPGWSLSGTNLGPTQATGPWFGDFNGDGRTDVAYGVCVSDCPTGPNAQIQIWVTLATATGFSQPIFTQVTVPLNYIPPGYTMGPQPIIGHVLGSGQDQLLIGQPFSGSNFWFCANYNAATSSFTATNTNVTLNGEFMLADLDGDGQSELVSWVSSNGNVQVRRNITGTGAAAQFASAQTIYTTNSASNPWAAGPPGSQSPAIKSADFNADGRADLLIPMWTGQSWTWLPLLSNGFAANGTVNPFSALPGFTGVVPQLLDWNGDGCTDVYAGSLQISNCAGGFVSYTLPSGVGPVSYGTGKLQSPIVLDWDGDGRQDLMYLHLSDNTWHVLRSNGADPNNATDVPTNYPFSTSNNSYYTIFQTGDGRPDLAAFNPNTPNTILTWYAHNSSQVGQDLATSFSDSFGMTQTLTYVPLTNGSTFTKSSGASYPEYDYEGPTYVVSQVVSSDGTGSSYQNQFQYSGARFNAQGRGFEGFAQRTTYDSRNGVYTYDTWLQSFPYTGMLVSRNRQTSSSVLSLWSGSNTSQISGGTGYEQRYFPFLSPITQKDYEIGAKAGQVVKQTQTTYTYGDGYGNPTQIVQTITDQDTQTPASPFAGQVWQTTVTSSYLNDPSAGAWCLGLPQSTQIQKIVPAISGIASAQTTQTRNDQYTPDANHHFCRIQTHTEEPAVAALTTATTYGYDGCGNVNSVSVAGSNPDGSPMAARTTTYDFNHSSGRCQFPEAITNAVGETTQRTYNFNFGVEATKTDANQLQTSWQQDDYGRVIRETRPDGTYDTWGYQSCNASNNFCGVADLRMLVLKQSLASDGSLIRNEYNYTDGFSRERYHEYSRVLGTMTIEGVAYDSLGRVWNRYLPYSNASNGYESFSYDVLDRKTSASLFQSNGTLDRTASWTYLGQTVHATNARAYTETVVHDVVQRIRQVADPAPGGTTRYGYGAFGDIVQIVDPTGATSSTAYTVRGNVIQTIDADRGSWVYNSDSIGELVSWTDAKNQSFGQSYDLLGRRLSRTEPEGLSNWVWGKVSDNTSTSRYADRLKSVSGYGYSEALTYDQLSRPATRTITSDQQYQYAYTYNSIGELSTLSYPASPIPTGGTGANLTLQYGYSYGSPVSVTDITNPASPKAIWSLAAANDYSSVTSESIGSGTYITSVISQYKPWTNELISVSAGLGGATANIQSLAYQWDADGNLTQRQDNLQSLTEVFTPDPLDRLASSTLNGQPNFSISYDAAGDILSRSDDGTAAHNFSYTYGNAGHPHAVMSTNGGLSYTYDANGNAITKNGLNFSWASYNMPTSLPANVGGTVLTSTFSYGPEHERYKQVANYSNGTETTYYIGDSLEKMVSATGVNYWRHYVATPSGRMVLISRNSDGTASTEYILTDHLGSSDAIVNASTGGISVRESFNPFGVRRGSNWSGSPTAADAAAIAGITRQGFTSHEHLDNIALIHMGGRVYDPSIGRFLSVDPIVGDVGDTQAHNPYSYVSNRPLASTDPTGLAEAPSMVEVVTEPIQPSDFPNLQLPGISGDSDGTDLTGRGGEPLSPLPDVLNTNSTGQQIAGSPPPAGSNAPTSQVSISAQRTHLVDFTPVPLMTRVGYHYLDYHSQIVIPDPEGTEIDVVARHSQLVKDDDILTEMGNSLGISFWICILDTHCSPSQWAKAGGTYAAGILMLPVVPERMVAAEVGARGGATALRALKAVNLPAWRKVGIDMAHVLERHTVEGALSAGRTTFPQLMNGRGIERAIRQAYRYGTKIGAQGDRVLMRGESGGLTIEMWVNRATQTIETAYPVVP